MELMNIMELCQVFGELVRTYRSSILERWIEYRDGTRRSEAIIS